MSNDLSAQEKIRVIDEELSLIARRMYQITLAARFQRQVGDSDRLKVLEDEAVKLSRFQQLYVDERKAISEERK